MTAPTDLRVEHLDEPSGITLPAPRLSWRLPSGTRRQEAYQVRAGSWDSGQVESEQSLLVPYAGPALRSGERVEWTVKVWTDAGESEWAEPAWCEMGMLAPDDWVARWIEPNYDIVRSQHPQPAWLLRDSFIQESPVERARLYVTAHGIYECFINGQRVGDHELTPGYTSYEANLHVQTFEVTELVTEGVNVLGAIVSGGWMTWTRRNRETGPGIGLLAQLHVDATDGSTTRVGTGPGWTVAVGAIRSVDLQQGQVVDLRDEPVGWSTSAGARGDWSAVTVRDYDLGPLCSSPAPPVRRVEELRPVALTQPLPDRYVVDFGQNVNGWIRLTDLGPTGTTLTLTHGEALDSNGDVTVDHVFGLAPDAPPFQRDHVTAAGRPGESFEPRHTTHGFRYVRVEGHPGELTVDDVTGVVVHTDLRRTGWFECSDERINRLHDAAVWSFRGNACDIPTDCPTRERVGWTGDWQIFVPTAAFLYDVAGFSTKWLRDLAADQLPDGVVWHCAPNPEPLEAYRDLPPGSAGWGDAAVIVPWEIYRAYGDRDLLAEQWPSMVAWVEYAARNAREQRHPSRVAARPDPAPHEQFLWDTGFHWGEWLEPDAFPDDRDAEFAANTLADLRTADHGSVATAYLHYSARLLSTIARILGRDADRVRFAALAAATLASWQTEFLEPDGTVTPPTQATYVRALAFQLIPDGRRREVAAHLIELIREADTHLATGFLATPYLLPVLADTGHLDVAYELLYQDSEPSWLTMIDRGATTVWEHWDGIDSNGLAHESLNHYGKGAVISFLHHYVAGIQLLDDWPAYRRFRIAPAPGGGITSARGAHDSPYGRIESLWHIDGDQFTLDVTVPPGTSAEIWLPDGQRLDAQPGTGCYVCAAPRSVLDKVPS